MKIENLKWHPYPEEKPETDKLEFITTIKMPVSNRVTTVSECVYDKDEDKWFMTVATTMVPIDVIAWCPYPEPYEPEKRVYLHDYAARIVDEFENVLDRYGIYVPSPEDKERWIETGNEAKLYGSTYSDLLDRIDVCLLTLAKELKTADRVVVGEFSGRS